MAALVDTSILVYRFDQRFPDKQAEPRSDEILVVKDVLVPGAPQGVSFTARRGEILGFAGLVGAGRTELMQVIFGVTPALGGTMLVISRVPFSYVSPLIVTLGAVLILRGLAGAWLAARIC